MNLTICLILFGILVLAGAAGLSRIISALAIVTSNQCVIIDLLTNLLKDLGPLMREACKREREASAARLEEELNEYRKLQAKAEAVGLTVEEYKASEAKHTEAAPHSLTTRENSN
jgi:hypothetical protein